MRPGITRCEMAKIPDDMAAALADVPEPQWFAEDFYSGWHSMQIMATLEIFPGADKQDYVNKYLSGLRPQVAARMVEDAEALFNSEVAQLVKQYKEEWDGSQ